MDLHKKTQKIREHNYHNDSLTPPAEGVSGQGRGEGKGVCAHLCQAYHLI